MTTPRFVACRCGHTKAEHEHEGLAPQCVHHGCTCLGYRASTAPDRLDDKAQLTVAPAQHPTPAVPTPDQLVAAGKRSNSKRTVALASKVEQLLVDLRGRLADERQAAEEKRRRDAEAQAARAEIERLERELAAAKERLKSRRHELGLGGGERKTDGINQCPDCPETFDTAQRLGVHRRWKHGHRKAS